MPTTSTSTSWFTWAAIALPGEGHEVGVQILRATRCEPTPRRGSVGHSTRSAPSDPPPAGATSWRCLRSGWCCSARRARLIEATLEHSEEAAFLESDVVVQEPPSSWAVATRSAAVPHRRPGTRRRIARCSSRTRCAAARHSMSASEMAGSRALPRPRSGPPVLLPEPVERATASSSPGARGAPQPARRLERVVMVAGEGLRGPRSASSGDQRSPCQAGSGPVAAAAAAAASQPHAVARRGIGEARRSASADRAPASGRRGLRGRSTARSRPASPGRWWRATSARRMSRPEPDEQERDDAVEAARPPSAATGPAAGRSRARGRSRCTRALRGQPLQIVGLGAVADQTPLVVELVRPEVLALGAAASGRASAS